jgi:hypothetical protein
MGGGTFLHIIIHITHTTFIYRICRRISPIPYRYKLSTINGLFTVVQYLKLYLTISASLPERNQCPSSTQMSQIKKDENEAVNEESEMES